MKNKSKNYWRKKKKRKRIIRKCTNARKTTCVNLSVKCNMSAEMSRVAVQTSCKNFYDHNYFFLSKDEAIERDLSVRI